MIEQGNMNASPGIGSAYAGPFGQGLQGQPKQPSDKKKNEIPAALDRIRELLEIQWKFLSEMQERLSPALAPVPEKEGRGVPLCGTTAYGSILAEIADKIRTHNEQLERTLKGLEL